MSDQKRPPKLAPQTRRAQGGVGAPHLHQGGAEGNATGPRETPGCGERRFGNDGPGTSGAEQHERKDVGWTSRQGGSQPGSRSGNRS
jgi:hypothetical protein